MGPQRRLLRGQLRRPLRRRRQLKAALGRLKAGPRRGFAASPFPGASRLVGISKHSSPSLSATVQEPLFLSPISFLQLSSFKILFLHKKSTHREKERERGAGGCSETVKRQRWDLFSARFLVIKLNHWPRLSLSSKSFLTCSNKISLQQLMGWGLNNYYISLYLKFSTVAKGPTQCAVVQLASSQSSMIRVFKHWFSWFLIV